MYYKTLNAHNNIVRIDVDVLSRVISAQSGVANLFIPVSKGMLPRIFQSQVQMMISKFVTRILELSSEIQEMVLLWFSETFKI